MGAGKPRGMKAGRKLKNTHRYVCDDAFVLSLAPSR
jgi:hypothetical protein